MGDLLRRHVWETSAFGAPSTWAASLLSSVNLCLNSGAPSCVYWGPDLLMLYNDAWSRIPGKRHPETLGKPAKEVWAAERWAEIGDFVLQVYASGASASIENHLLPLEHSDGLQEHYFTHNSSAIHSLDGRVQGVFNGSTETTQLVLATRRAQALTHLSEALFHSQDPTLRARPALQALAEAERDIPFLAYYERDAHQPGSMRLQAVAGSALTGVQNVSGILPPSLPVDENGHAVTPFAVDRVAHSLPAQWQLLRLAGSSLKNGWGAPITRVLLVPLRAGGALPQAWLLCGLSPTTLLDASYISFFGGAASLLSTAATGQPPLAAEPLAVSDAAAALERSRFATWSYEPGTTPAEGRLQVTPEAARLLATSGTATPALHQKLAAAMEQAAERDELLSLHVPVTGPDGKDRWLLLQGSAVQSEDGTRQVAGVVGDITPHHTKFLAVCEDDKLDVVRRLTATIAHELNNPLESLTNLVYLASLDENLSPSTHQLLAHAESELARVNFTAQQTLGFARDPLGPTRTDIRALIVDLVRQIERSFNGEGVRIDLSGVQSAMFPCYQGELRQVLSNLILNALAACSSSGCIRVFARLSQHHTTGESILRIGVGDNGIGIAPENRARIFSAFFTTHRDKGNGLGLWIAKNLLKKQHGTIRFRSRTGQASGTCFIITLPTQIRRSFVQ